MDFEDVFIVKGYDVKELGQAIIGIERTRQQLANCRFGDSFDESLKAVLDDAGEQLVVCKEKWCKFVESWTEAIAYLGDSIDDYNVPSLTGPFKDAKKPANHIYVALYQFLESYKRAVIQNQERNALLAAKLAKKKKEELEREMQELKEARRLAMEQESSSDDESDTESKVNEAKLMFDQLSELPPQMDYGMRDFEANYEFDDDHQDYD
jgi:hypothetical protein